MTDHTILIQNALILTMNPQREIIKGDILISGNRIVEISESISTKADEVISAENHLITPGFVQTHVHLCQALFRNLADDLPLLDWLEQKIWPFEAGHSSKSIRLSAQLGIAELFLSGTTTIMDMGTVNHQDDIFNTIAESGIRAVAGKAMMDYGNHPAGLQETTKASIDESLRLLDRFFYQADGGIRDAFAPRFALSCSDDLLRETGKLARDNNVLYHTHAAENVNEAEIVHQRFGVSNIQLFDTLGVADENLCLAHCVWTDSDDRKLLKERDIKVLHCPSANLKLGSGFAPIPDYLEKGITVSLGADGAPCNNNLSIFQEMRLAALIQKPLAGPESMPAEQVVQMATINGARTLGIQDEIGSLEPGKRADLTFIKINQVHAIPFDNIYSKIVYSTQASDVKHVLINGKWVLRDRILLTIDEDLLVDRVQNNDFLLTGV